MEVLANNSMPPQNVNSSPALTGVRFDPDPQTRRRKIHCKQELIVNSLQRFYSMRTDMDEIMPILLGTSPLSLRLIDWFVTNYAKAHNTAYILDNQEFLVYMNYKSQLKAYSKKLFDPFCRRERIYFQIPGHSVFLTTVGKLNFFRWAIEKGVLDYLKLHQEAVEKEMNSSMKEQAKIRKSTPTTSSGGTSSSTQSTAVSEVTLATQSTKSSTRRRTAASAKEAAAAKQMQKHTFEIEMRFD
jgi:hypothetical protein